MKKALLGIVILATGAFAQTGTPVLPADPITSFQSYGATSVRVVSVHDSSVPFTQAIRVTLNAPLTFSYDASLYWNTAAAVPSGDFLLVSFWVKNLDPSGTPVLRLEPKMQVDASPYPADLDGAAPADGTAWHHYAIPVRATMDYPDGNPTSSLQIFFGTAAQKFEIGGVGILDFGVVPDPIPPSLVSQFAYYYPDRGNPKAAWRQKALSNIEAFRKSNLTVQVQGQDGSPVAGAPVTAQETNPAFRWGSAIDSDIIVRDTLSPKDKKKYIAAILSNFNAVVFENDLKWPDWEADRQLALDGVAWVEAHGLPFRGHNLIWPSFALMPSGLQQLSARKLNAAINAHFEDELGTLAHQAYQWDVVNEPYDNTDVQGLIGGVPGVQQSNGVLGNPVIAHWYQLARQIDNTTLLHVNDYSLFENKNPVHEAYDVALVKYIQSLGGEVDGIGFESHFGQGGPVFSDMDATQSDFSSLVSEFGVTEYDFATIDPGLQQDLTNDYMTYVFGSPQIGEFLMWGFWDGADWQNNAPIYNLDWSIKPSGKVFQRLTQQTWRSNPTGATDAQGDFTARVFQGSYTLSVTVNGTTCTAPATVTADSEVTIMCPQSF